MTLDRDIMTAHERGDHSRLITLYTTAADLAPDTDTECYLLTYAYIFALEQGDEATGALFDRLRRHGRV